MKVEVFSNIDSVDSGLWDSLAGDDDPFSSHRFIQSVEKADFAGYKFWYLMFFEHGNPVATVALFSARVNAELLTDGTPRSVIHAVRTVVEPFMVFKVLFCGLPVSLGKNNLRIAEGADKSAVLNLLWQNMLEIARRERITTLVFKELDQQEAAAYGELQKFGFHRVDSFPTNELPIEWDTYEGYLRALRHRYRQSIVRSQRKINVPEIRVQTHSDFGAVYSPEIYQLYENVLEAVPYKLEILPHRFFLNINTYFPTESELIVVRKHEKPIGKILMLYSPRRAFAMFLGMDYTSNQRYDLYFNMLAQIIKRSIEMGKQLLDLGQSSYQAKGRMGARAKPLYLYIMHLNPLLNALIRRATPWLFPVVPIAPHSVFKAT